MPGKPNVLRLITTVSSPAARDDHGATGPTWRTFGPATGSSSGSVVTSRSAAASRARRGARRRRRSVRPSGPPTKFRRYAASYMCSSTTYRSPARRAASRAPNMRLSTTTRSAGSAATVASRSRPMPRSPNVAIISQGRVGAHRAGVTRRHEPQPGTGDGLLLRRVAEERGRRGPGARSSPARAVAGGTLPPPSQVTKRMLDMAFSGEVAGGSGGVGEERADQVPHPLLGAGAAQAVVPAQLLPGVDVGRDGEQVDRRGALVVAAGQVRRERVGHPLPVQRAGRRPSPPARSRRRAPGRASRARRRRAARSGRRRCGRPRRRRRPAYAAPR